MKGINRADKAIRETKLYSESKKNNTPCIFISYQRKDEIFAEKVAEYIKEWHIDIYFDKEDINLSKTNSPMKVTEAIKKGLNESNYMIIVISENTYKSFWVPFEIGYAYDNMGKNMKLLKHKNQTEIPDYLRVKEFLSNFSQLRSFLGTIRSGDNINEIKTFSEFTNNPLNEYLD